MAHTLPRVGIAGMGLVSALGNSVDAAWERLMSAEGAVRRMQFDGLPDVAAAQATFDASAVLSKLHQVGTERVSQMALAAAKDAMADAGLSAWADAERVGLYLGTGMGGASSIDAGYSALYGGRRTPPLTVPASMVNGAAAVVALHTEIRGPVITYAVACASSAVAIAEAAHALRRREIDVAIAGGSEAVLTRGTVAAWQALRTLAPPDPDDVSQSCKPFSSDRSGLVLGEGAAFLVLRREEDFLRERVSPKAWFSGAAVRCDATHLTQPDVRGQVSALRAALASAGLQPADIGYCNAHGTATTSGDPVECESLRQVWGAGLSALAVSSTKAAHGHLLGAAGALEALWAVQAVRRGEVPPTKGLLNIDPQCGDLNHVLAAGQQQPGLRHAISNSFAFGGTNAALIFSRVS